MGSYCGNDEYLITEEDEEEEEEEELTNTDLLIGLTMIEAQKKVGSGVIYYSGRMVEEMRAVKIDKQNHSRNKDKRKNTRLNVFVENDRISEIEGCY